MTRRDIMLLSTAMLSYQASYPKVLSQDDPRSNALNSQGLDLTLQSHMPHAGAARTTCMPVGDGPAAA